MQWPKFLPENIEKKKMQITLFIHRYWLISKRKWTKIKNNFIKRLFEIRENKIREIINNTVQKWLNNKFLGGFP